MFGGYGGGWGSAYYGNYDDDDGDDNGDDDEDRNDQQLDGSFSSSSTLAALGGNFGSQASSSLRSSEQRGDRNAAEKIAAADELETLRNQLDAPDLISKQQQQQQEKQSCAIDKNFVGFLDKDGNRRDYEAPAPPSEVEWPLLTPRLLKWNRAACENWRSENSTWTPEDVDGKEPYLFMSSADSSPESEFGSDDTANAVRETEEILRPMAISPEISEGKICPRRWTPAVERALRDRGIRLADSIVLSVETTEPGRTEPTKCKYGVRVFHVNFRYFVVVIVGGNFKDEEKREFSLSDGDGKRMMGYYYLAMSVDQAITERCV